MPVSRPLSIILLTGLLAVPALAADPPYNACLNKAEQRAAVADKKAIPLARAIKSRREHGHHADPVRARLCRHGDGLVYVPVSYTHLRAHETRHDLVCRLL